MKTELVSEVSTDRLEQTIQTGEAVIARVRALQIEALHELDIRQVPLADGSRNLAEWTASRLDLTPETARQLARTTRRLADQPDLAEELAQGTVSFDRAAEESRLIALGADPGLIAKSRGWDLGGVRRMAARQHRITHADEQNWFDARQLTIQPNLDETFYKLWGALPGMEGRLVEQALTERADQFPSLPNGKQQARSQRLADALVAMSQDSLDGNHPRDGGSNVPVVSIFVDGQLAAETNGEAGAVTDHGVRVGPLTLEEILCDGKVEILATTPEGKPLTVGPKAKTTPPRLRRFVLHRDGGACTVDGCRSRYRLQPHHITPRSQGGTHDPNNLTTLCWFHHHIVIHRHGYRIDPTTPPQRRRFLGPQRRGPP